MSKKTATPTTLSAEDIEILEGLKKIHGGRRRFIVNNAFEKAQKAINQKLVEAELPTKYAEWLWEQVNPVHKNYTYQNMIRIYSWVEEQLQNMQIVHSYIEAAIEGRRFCTQEVNEACYKQSRKFQKPKLFEEFEYEEIAGLFETARASYQDTVVRWQQAKYNLQTKMRQPHKHIQQPDWDRMFCCIRYSQPTEVRVLQTQIDEFEKLASIIVQD